MLTFSASEEELELYCKQCKHISNVFKKLSNAANIDDAERAKFWKDLAGPLLVQTEQFERTYGKYVPTPPSGARRSGYVPPDS